MSQEIIANYNGKNEKLSELKIAIEDRAYFFGDGVYEVISVYNGKPFLFNEHLERLNKSLKEILIETSYKFSDAILGNIKNNKTINGYVYLQVSRGSSPRAHSFFNQKLTPNILIYTKSLEHLNDPKEYEQGVKTITYNDSRWARCNIKSINLLPNCLAQSEAFSKQAKEAIFIHEKLGALEGSASNIFIVKNNSYITPPLSNHILPGIMRGHLLALLQKAGLNTQEKYFTKDDLIKADEVFLTSTTKEALGVVQIDNHTIANGQVGEATKKARKLILDSI